MDAQDAYRTALRDAMDHLDTCPTCSKWWTDGIVRPCDDGDRLVAALTAMPRP